MCGFFFFMIAHCKLQIHIRGLVSYTILNIAFSYIGYCHSKKANYKQQTKSNYINYMLHNNTYNICTYNNMYICLYNMYHCIMYACEKIAYRLYCRLTSESYIKLFFIHYPYTKYKIHTLYNDNS